jgi:hypothetical protein
MWTVNQTDRLRAYGRQVEATYRALLAGHESRFTGWRKLMARFSAEIEAVATHDGAISAVNEAHNEIAVAAELLRRADLTVAELSYEPKLTNTAKKIDFQVGLVDGRTYLVEVKTIVPVPRDRWDQFEHAQRAGWLGDAVWDLDKEELGGELWHDAFAARSKMLEYSLQFEQRLTLSGVELASVTTVLMLCGTGFEWKCHELEDFATYYRLGVHRPDDPWARAEIDAVSKKGIVLQQNIDEFACMFRPTLGVQPTTVVWNVLQSAA